MTTTYVARASEALAEELDRTGHGGNPTELLDLYALLVMAVGEACTLRDVHSAWALWRLRTRPTHPDLVPFDQLSEETASWDAPYRDAIVATAARLAGEGWTS